MNTEKTTLRLRRATPLDAVNLYRLQVDEEKKTGLGRPFDEAARMAHIIVVIAEGYVSVAEVSGRIVGSVAAVPRQNGFTKEPVLTGEWFVIVSSLRKTQLGAKMLQRLCKFADQQQMTVQFTLPAHMEASTAKVAADAGFENKGYVLAREPGLKIDEVRREPEEAAPEPAPDEAGRELPDAGEPPWATAADGPDDFPDGDEPG